MSKQRTRTEVKTAIDVSETAERKRGRPQAAQGTDLKLALLRSAIDLFAERGFDGVSLSNVAEKAGADKGLSRYYFGSKEALWIAAMEHLADCFASDLNKALVVNTATQTEALKALIRAFITALSFMTGQNTVIAVIFCKGTSLCLFTRY